MQPRLATSQRSLPTGRCASSGTSDATASNESKLHCRLQYLETAGAFFGTVAKPLQPRFYSISSSPKAHPRTVHITCSVIREPKGTGRLHHGVASTWLGRLPIGERGLGFTAVTVRPA